MVRAIKDEEMKWLCSNYGHVSIREIRQAHIKADLRLWICHERPIVDDNVSLKKTMNEIAASGKAI